MMTACTCAIADSFNVRMSDLRNPRCPIHGVLPENARWKSEDDARQAMQAAEARRDYEVAAVAAVQYAEYVGCRTSNGASVILQQAQVYATLHHAQQEKRA